MENTCLICQVINDDHDFVDDKDFDHFHFDHGKEMMATLKEEWVQHISLWEAGRLPFT